MCCVCGSVLWHCHTICAAYVHTCGPVLLQEALATITEHSEAGVTVRGNYYPEGKEPPEDKRKLYLAIEATTEIAVQKAKGEITHIIKEEMQRRVWGVGACVCVRACVLRSYCM